MYNSYIPMFNETVDEGRTLYHVTINFNPKYFNSTASKHIELVWKLYNKIYRFIVSNLMNNFTRKRNLHPITLDFIDFEGTRYNTYVRTRSCSVPHIHSIWSIHPDTLEEFKEMIKSEFKKLSNHHKMDFLLNIDVREVGKSDEDLREAIQYDSKFASGKSQKSFEHEGVNLFSEYPISSSDFNGKRARSNCPLPKSPNECSTLQIPIAETNILTPTCAYNFHQSG